MTHSVLIAAYHAAAYLPKALDSLRAQQDADWELIVVEDGSHDGTEAIVRRFAESTTQPVRYLNPGRNQGVGAVRTLLLASAQGEYCSFLDADDWWTPEHLSNARREFAAGADLVVSGIQLHDIDANKPLGEYTPAKPLVEHPAAALFASSVIMTSSCVSLRRMLASRVGAFDAQLRIGEDRDFWLRCAMAGAKFAITREVTCTYAKHSTSTMARTQNWAAAETAFFEKYLAVPVVPAGIRRRQLAHALQNQARLARSSSPVQSAALLKRALGLAPWRADIFLQWLYSISLKRRVARA